MLSRARAVFQRRPLLTNVTSFGAMYAGAEATQQTILLFLDKDKKERGKLDWATVGRFGLIGLGCIGPLLFGWYRVLDRALPATSSGAVAKKVLADQLISSTSCIAIFFTGMSILEGKEDIFAEVKAKFWSTYQVSCCFWLPAQALNFALLPPYSRVAFVGAASFVWVNVLCLLKRRRLPEPPVEVVGEITDVAVK
ncbi:hypothetical protein JTE90_014978 [Oedothorax gibbosus]|uniref:Mpv17-like protein n=1 Tax=Oedothorax gibbosus TaxID=931172 RepID=A0AAV6V089_9ARAC|nr:hypothetical protein JTE90_014978 [Oedothorax gibbosus]